MSSALAIYFALNDDVRRAARGVIDTYYENREEALARITEAIRKALDQPPIEASEKGSRLAQEIEQTAKRLRPRGRPGKEVG